MTIRCIVATGVGTRRPLLVALSCLALFAAALVQAGETAAATPLTPEQQTAWRATLKSSSYTAIAKAYADFMIAHGRDTYGPQHTPLFVTGLDRHTGKMIVPPFPHVKRKPFMPGWERDRECRPSDRNEGQADPLDQMILLQLMHRLSEITKDSRYAMEADKTAAWWLENCQSSIGLYPWGTHTFFNIQKDLGEGLNSRNVGRKGWFEYNHIWPFWELNPDALQKYAMGLWDHYIYDKKTGDFNRHANALTHGPQEGMEFPWPGSTMISTWVEAYLVHPDPEYLRAIHVVLDRWESLRDANGHLAPCSNYKEWAWYQGYIVAANRIDDTADRIEAKHPELAEKMRQYGRRNDAAYLKISDKLLNIKSFGPVRSYLRATGGFNPERLDIIGGPWQDRKDWAGFAVKLHERMKRNDSPELQRVYQRAVLDTAEVYMSINPEVQWSVWGANVANAIRLMLAAHDLTGNVAYLHRADHFGRMAVELFFDEASPLPKITSQDDFYEIEAVGHVSGDSWLLAALDLEQRLAQVSTIKREPKRFSSGRDLGDLATVPLVGAAAQSWRDGMAKALSEKQGGVWRCSKLELPVASAQLSYGGKESKALFLSRRQGELSNTLSSEGMELIISDWVNKLPTLEEVKPYNGAYRRKFSGKHREVSTARYGGYKDVLDKAGLHLVNHGQQDAKVKVTVTYHDSWDDRESNDTLVTIKAGEGVLVACDSPGTRFIRRIDLVSSVPDAVKLEHVAFAMVPRSKVNPPPLNEQGQTSDAVIPTKKALLFMIAGQSNAGGVAAFSPETNKKAGMAEKHPTIPGSTAVEVGIPTTMDDYPRAYIWGKGFERLKPGKNTKTGYRDPWRHGIELPIAMRLQQKYPSADIFFVKHGPGGHNLHTQWKAGRGKDYKIFMNQFKPAMADLKQRYETVDVIGLYWDQGESDHKQAVQYEDNLRELFTALRNDTGIPDLQIYVREQGIFQHDKPDFKPIVDAQVTLCREDPNTHLLELDLGSNEKNFKAWAWTDKNGHLSSKAYLELSKKLIQPKPLKVLCVGDSITAARNGYVGRLAAADGIETFNGGRGGHRAANATERLQKALEAADKAGFQPNLVTLLLGINDLPARDKRPGEVKIGVCVDGMDAAIRAALTRFRPEQIVLLAPCDVNPATMSKVVSNKGYGQAKELLPGLEAEYRKLAAKHGVRFHSFLSVVGPQNLSDGLHPNDAGHAQLAASLRAYLQP